MRLNGVMEVCQKKMLNDKEIYLNFWQSYSGGHWINYFISRHDQFARNSIRYIHESDHTHIQSSTIDLLDSSINRYEFSSLVSKKICVGSVQHNPEIQKKHADSLLKISKSYNIKVFHCYNIVRGGRFDIMKNNWPDIERPIGESWTKWWKDNFPDLAIFDVNKIIDYDEQEYEKLCDFIGENPLPKQVMEYEIENYKKIIKWS